MWKFRLTLLFSLFFLWAPCLKAQSVPAEFRRITDSLIEARPITYAELNEALRPYRRDTVMMNYFIRQCQLEEFGDGLSYAYNQLGTRYRNISDYPKAIENHEKGLEAAERANNLEFRIFSLNMLGVVYRRLEAIKTALDYNQEALQLAENIANPSEGIKRSINVSLNSIGNIYQALEQYDRAIEHFARSMVLEEELGNKRGVAINLQNKGECLEALGRLDEALADFQQALYLDREIGSLSGEVICHNSIARIYIKQDKAAEALELLQQALPQAEETKDQQIICPVNINLGWAYMAQGQYDQAQRYLDRGLRIGLDHNYLRDISQCYGLLSELHSHLGQYRQALEYLKQSEVYNEQVTNDVNVQYVNDVILRYDSDKKTSQIEILARENEIVKLKLRRNRTTLLVGALLLVLFTLILYILYRQYQLNSEKKVLTLEQSMLRSQMNPHFLFNSLNSIKLYIINNEQKNAVHYLNKFSKLVRKILEASSLKEIPLEEELETVELYMNIENIRFNNEIDFSIQIHPEINPSLVKIPSLILQPFLENALWHGLSSKDGRKRIELEVCCLNSGYITIRIRDNGIGREEAERLKEQRVLKRKSVGIDITRERLANFSKDYQNSYALEIEDLKDEEGNATGTLVTLKIPTV